MEAIMASALLYSTVDQVKLEAFRKQFPWLLPLIHQEAAVQPFVWHNNVYPLANLRVERIDLKLFTRTCEKLVAYPDGGIFIHSLRERLIILDGEGRRLVEVGKSILKERQLPRFWKYQYQNIGPETPLQAFRRLSEADQKFAARFVLSIKPVSTGDRPQVYDPLGKKNMIRVAGIGVEVVIHKTPGALYLGPWIDTLTHHASEMLAKELKGVDLVN